MRNNVLEILVSVFVISFFTISCQNTQNQAVKNSNNQQQIQNLSGNDLSKLENGIMVRFPAVLKKGSETECIEIFNEDEFKNYKGDPKWAAASRFASDSLSTSFEEGKKVLVTGKMTFVKDVSNTSKTCGIVTGQIFEITEIQNL